MTLSSDHHKPSSLKPSSRLDQVRYEIRGELAHRAQEMERDGLEILKLNIGNPGQFGLRTPEPMRKAMIRNLGYAEGYGHQKGIFPAREAVATHYTSEGIDGLTAEHIFLGNGVSELIDMCLRGLLEAGDEVLVPSPDYPLWSAAVILNGGVAVHYPCHAANGFIPDMEQLAALVTPRTRALVLINPNNPTGAVYPKAVLEQIVQLAESHQLVLFSDEIYDQVLFDNAEFQRLGPLVENTLCVTFGGLSKVYRACGYRVGWAVLSGAVQNATDYQHALELLAALRLCSNVPGQWAVQTALGGHQSIHELIEPGGRLYESRRALIDGVAASRHLDLVSPAGAMYGFPSIRAESLAGMSDHEFALRLLQEQQVLVVPGSSFNFQQKNHFRLTLLPDRATLSSALDRIDYLLDH